MRSYRTVSPLPPSPDKTTAAAVCFLWHCPASHLGLPLAITLLCEVRTFLDSSSMSRGRPANSSAWVTYAPGRFFRDWDTGEVLPPGNSVRLTPLSEMTAAGH